MGNRQQRRAAMKKGKRNGETYADVLSRRKMIQEAVQQSAHSHAVSLEADIKSQRLLWMSVEALNRAFGFGGKRAMDYMMALDEVASEFEALSKEHGHVYAVEKLRQRCEQITGMEVREVHEEEILKAKRENEANGIFFSEPDPDDWEV